ncbi:Uncharacterised protein [Vibrio cholerae]|nr:Uncharacterised protein [Vibrio cholerae]
MKVRLKRFWKRATKGDISKICLISARGLI